MIRQIWDILKAYSYYKTEGSDDEKELLALALPAMIKAIKEYLTDETLSA